MTLEAPVYGRSELPEDFSSAVLLMDKPLGWSSFGVVKRLRYLLQVRKIGHAGTLDPAATGLLICLVGRATRRMEAFMHLPKTYEAVMRLGESTASYDAETPVVARSTWHHLTGSDLEQVRQRFTGTLQQVPPMYSAVKVQGERLYRKARRGEVVARKPNTVQVYSLAFTGWSGADVSFAVRCSKGTYIRSLAHEMGQALGSGAHLVALRRTAIGDYEVRNAWTVCELAAALGRTLS